MTTAVFEGTSKVAKSDLEIAFRLPVPGWPRAVFHGDNAYRGGALEVGGEVVLEADGREELEGGVTGKLGGGQTITLCLAQKGESVAVVVAVDGERAIREGKIWAKPSRSAWIHAFLALGGSGAGFAASVFYLLKAHALNDEWALKMGNHTAGWHLLLTLTLFPASVWGQRTGIRAVQVVSFVFFCIHAGMAIANSDLTSPWIAFFNAVSCALFLASTLYGNQAYRDMDPVAALVGGRV